MPEKEEHEPRVKRNILRGTLFSRRQFLKRTGVAAAGALVTSLAMTVACKTGLVTTETTTGGKTNQTVTSNPGTPVSSSTVPSSSPAVSTSNPVTPTTTTSTTQVSTTQATTTQASTTQASTTPATSGYSYIAPTSPPPLLPIAGTTCNVATDRKYSTDNIWVKSLSETVVVIGVSTTMVDILANPYHLTLPKVGATLVIDDVFGAMEGTKMSADLISPLSGTVLQVNEVLNSLVKQGSPLTPLIQDPYNSGWMMVVQLNKPAELDNLVTPQRYIELVLKKY